MRRTSSGRNMFVHVTAANLLFDILIILSLNLYTSIT